MKPILFTFILLGLALVGSAQEPFVATEGFGSVSLGRFLGWREDAGNSLRLDEARRLPFAQSREEQPNFGWSSSAFWFKLRLEDRRVSPELPLVLEVGWPLLDTLDLWFLDTSGKVLKEAHVGDSVKRAEGDYQASRLAFTVPKGDSLEVYLRAKSMDMVQLPLTLREEHAFIGAAVGRSAIWGGFFGAIILMFAYSTFMAIFLRDRVYLLYSAYLATMGFLEVSYLGIGYDLVWGSLPGFQNVSLPVTMALFYIASAWFAMDFLEVDNYLRQLAPHFRAVIAACTVCLVLSFFVSPMIMGIGLNLIVFYGGGIILLASFLMMLRGSVPARYFLAAWSFYVAGGLLLVLKDLRLLPSTHFTDKAIHVGFALQIFLFLLALADRMNRIKREREQERAKFETLFETAIDCIFVSDLEGRFVQVNKAGLDLFGFSREELLGLGIRDLLLSQGPEVYTATMAGLAKGIDVEVERSLIKKDGTRFDAILRARLAPGGLIEGFVHDITARKREEEKLRRLVDEKQALIREIHHRSNNNMQVISALLEFQAVHKRDQGFQAAVADMQLRIGAMSMVQRLLYEAGDLSMINLDEYIGNLSGIVARKHRREDRPLALRFEADRVPVLIDTAIPCSLILTELVSNAYAHAFPGGSEGEILVSLRRSDDGLITLGVSDRGQGAPPGFNPRQGTGLGLFMVIGLVTDQLKGDIDFNTEAGFACEIRFRDNLYAARV